MTEACSLLDELIPYRDTPGVCDAHGTPLTGRQTRWCSSSCAYVLTLQHDWNAARRAVVARDGNKCVSCGKPGDVNHLLRSTLEVNHIVPRVGKGYGWGCWNHHDNLETLCHDCHVKVTNAQAAERRAAQASWVATRGRDTNTEPLLS